MLGKLSKKEALKEYVLGKIIRYNHRRRLQDESVAEHSFYVSLFCLKIMKQIPTLTTEEKFKILTLAILHDTAESVTSDIPHDVKMNYPKMKEVLEKVEEDYYKENWKEYEDALTSTSKIINYIVNLADCYSVYQYCLNEKSLGNVSKDIDDIYNDSQDRIENWTDRLNRELRKRENNEISRRL